eukprot:4978563-Pyramimonas_sp.AAC.1
MVLESPLAAHRHAMGEEKTSRADHPPGPRRPRAVPSRMGACFTAVTGPGLMRASPPGGEVHTHCA